MATIILPKTLPPVLHHFMRERNGRIPDWKTGRGIAYRMNHALAYERKCVFERFSDYQNIPQGYTTSPTVQWRGYFQSGHASTTHNNLQLRCEFALLPGDNSSGGADPRARIGVQNTASPGWTYTPYRHAAFSDASLSPGLDDIIWATASVTISANAAYEWKLELEERCRCVGLTLYEVASKKIDTDDAYVIDNREYADGNDITAGQHGKLCVDVGHDLWKHNGCHLATLVPETEAAGYIQYTSTSWGNLLDGSGTTVDGNSRGWDLAAQYHGARHAPAAVPCKLSVYGKYTGGTGADLRLQDASGTLATLSGFTTAFAWQTTTFTLDGSAASTHKVDVHAKCDASSTLDIASVCLMEHAV